MKNCYTIHLTLYVAMRCLLPTSTHLVSLQELMCSAISVLLTLRSYCPLVL